MLLEFWLFDRCFRGRKNKYTIEQPKFLNISTKRGGGGERNRDIDFPRTWLQDQSRSNTRFDSSIDETIRSSYVVAHVPRLRVMHLTRRLCLRRIPLSRFIIGDSVAVPPNGRTNESLLFIVATMTSILSNLGAHFRKLW